VDVGGLRQREDNGGKVGAEMRAAVRRAVQRGRAYGHRKCPGGLLRTPSLGDGWLLDVDELLDREATVETMLPRFILVFDKFTPKYDSCCPHPLSMEARFS
jgi:hypothetical protein